MLIISDLMKTVILPTVTTVSIKHIFTVWERIATTDSATRQGLFNIQLDTKGLTPFVETSSKDSEEFLVVGRIAS